MEPISPSSFLDEYKIIKTLGSGYHAKVKLAEKDGKQYAIKRFKQDTADLSVLQHELTIMSKLEHPNIVRLFEVREKATYRKKNGCQYSCFAIILEYINGGELFEYVARCGKFSPNISRTYFTMLLDALSYMHSKGISHRDIKPQNILLDKDFNLKVTDFGFSTYLSRGQLHTRLGTEGYMAPQIRTRNYDGKDVDLFAAGVILFILYSGSPPFQKAVNTDPYYKVFSNKNYGVFWNAHSRKKPEGFYSNQFKDLINKMLLPKPQERYTMEQVRNHPWTTGDSVTLNQIYEEFKIRKQKIDQARQKEREEKLRKKQQMENFQSSNSRSGGQFQNYYKLLEEIDYDPALLKVADRIDSQDLVINEKPKNFIASLKQLLEQKKNNLIADDEQIEEFQVTVDSQKQQVVINLNYQVLEEDQNLRVICQLSKTKDDLLRIKFLRDENGSSIRSHNLIEIVRNQFAYLTK